MPHLYHILGGSKEKLGTIDSGKGWEGKLIFKNISVRTFLYLVEKNGWIWIIIWQFRELI